MGFFWRGNRLAVSRSEAACASRTCREGAAIEPHALTSSVRLLEPQVQSTEKT